MSWDEPHVDDLLVTCRCRGRCHAGERRPLALIDHAVAVEMPGARELVDDHEVRRHVRLERVHCTVVLAVRRQPPVELPQRVEIRCAVDALVERESDVDEPECAEVPQRDFHEVADERPPRVGGPSFFSPSMSSCHMSTLGRNPRACMVRWKNAACLVPFVQNCLAGERERVHAEESGSPRSSTLEFLVDVGRTFGCLDDYDFESPSGTSSGGG